MRTTGQTLIERAEALGAQAARDYKSEFGQDPSPHDVGDWDSTAWGEHRKTLEAEGATEEDYTPCLDAWFRGYWGDL